MDRSFSRGSTEEADNVKIFAGLRIAFDPTKSPHYKLTLHEIYDCGSNQLDDNHDDNDDDDDDDYNDDELLQQFQAENNIYEFIPSFVRCYKNAQDDEDDDKNDDDENAQDDDDEAQSESEDDGDDFIHPKLTTHDDETTHEEETDEDDTFDPIVHTPSHVSSSDDEDSDNEVEGVDVEGEKSDDDATYVEDQGNEAGRDTNANLEGRDDVQADVVLPQVQVTQEIEDTHVTLTPVNPDGQQQSSSVSSGFVSNMLNPNQDTGVDAIFGHNAEATSLVDIPVTAIAEPSFSWKRPRDSADDDQEPSAGTDRGSKIRRSGKEPESTSAPRETTTTTAEKTTTGSKTHKQSASQSALVEETMQTTDVFEAPAH
ncbi:hypothetical protein Tco_1121184 [Tanacetum coccineum]|uniref:Uncharacterized protein n=1 Tax=Tanacetum coccineum TaxID=301880 RepID=A0ABQ5J0M7_9ASTR